MILHLQIFRIIIFFILSCFISQTVLGQESDDTLNNIKKPVALNCNPPSANTCNLFENNNFNTTCFGDYPFTNNCVSSWTSSHGSPQLNVFGPLHTSGANHASMWASSSPTPQGNEYIGEGIATGIHKLTIGHTYSLSIFKKYYSNPASNFAPDVDNFYIVLLKCADFLALQTPHYVVPQIPQNSQIIYCEQDMNNTSWERINQCFVANDEYDIVWIFPKETTIVPGRTFQTWLEVTLPEIVDMSSFTAGPSPTVTYPNCNVTIGPSSPNCSVTGAIFTWYDPSGIPHSALPNQTITVNAAIDYGTWILTMTVPNIVTTNNSCSQTCSIQSTVFVQQCLPCTTPAQVLSSSYINPSCNNPNVQITPYSLNYKCNPWECGLFTNLEANYSSGNKWYINGVPIPDNNNGSIPGIGIVWLYSNSKKLQHTMDQTVTTQLFNFQVKNDVQGCGILTQPTQVYYSYTLFPLEDMGWYKPNYTRTINIPFGYTVGTGSIYTWSIPGAIVTDIDNTTPEASVYFPASIPLPTVYGTLTVSNSPYCNGVYNIFFTYNPQLKTPPIFSVPTGVSSSTNGPSSISINPNPASNQIVISAKEEIKSVEITDIQQNTFIKMYKLKGLKSVKINVTDIRSGIYYCRIITDSLVENKRIIIQH